MKGTWTTLSRASRVEEYENGKQICRKKFSVDVEVIQMFEVNIYFCFNLSSYLIKVVYL